MRPALLATLAAAAAVLGGAEARADMWCATPLLLHEWGVHVFGPDGATATGADALPAWFHTPSSRARVGPGGAVRGLPADNGVRKLPVVHLYAAEGERASIPVALEVGFAHGAASAWYPAVDTLRAAAVANGPGAAAAKAQLLIARDARLRGAAAGLLPSDPTRQLVWDRLDLERSPWAAPAQVDAGSWVDAARGLDEALWVNGRGESERFVFYEAATTERVPLAFFRGRNGLHLRNDGPHAVHDVFVVNRAPRGLGDVVTVVFVADLAAGDAAPIDLGGPALSPADAAAATVGRLRGRLVNPLFPDARAIFEAPSAGPCAMGRDPALPTEQAAGFQLFAGEADLLLSVWEKRFFGAPGVTVVYREDPAALDAAMPLSVYTDMRHVPVVHRAGLAVWEHVRLP